MKTAHAWRVLIIGGGGREHALAWKIAQSAAVETVYCAPGNAGTAREDKTQNLDIAVQDIDKLVDFATKQRIDLTIVGPEAPLVAGIVDRFIEADLRCFGPRRNAAILEGSKAFTKDFLLRHEIPAAHSASFDTIDAARDYIHQQPLPIVVKADGLAAGKGVVIAATHSEAITAAEQMLCGNAFGEAGLRIVVEEFLHGEEVSFIVMTDGEHIIPFASSQDHKARDEGDRGPNTGGMGAYSPAPLVDAALHTRIIDQVIRPTLRGMAAEGRRYQGFLYAGLMISAAGEPRVLEYNCRFGDPETQAIMVRLRSDLAAACLAVLDGQATGVALEWDPRVALGVVMAARGYPADYDKGAEIEGLGATETGDHVVFHAGTACRADTVVTNGGRVLCVVGLGAGVSEAQRAAYGRVAGISFAGSFYRRDIGYRAIARN